jgi:hypothetical protein
MAKIKQKKPRNKKYTGKYAEKIPMLFKLTQPELDELKTMTQGALFSLVSGTANMFAWRDILWRLVVGREMAIRYFKEEEACELFHEAIRRQIRIYQAHQNDLEGAWMITQEDAEAFSEACDLADTMIPQLTRREYTQVYEPLAKTPISTLANQDISWAEYKTKFLKQEIESAA